MSLVLCGLSAQIHSAVMSERKICNRKDAKIYIKVQPVIPIVIIPTLPT